jgi:hypothetical protein
MKRLTLALLAAAALGPACNEPNEFADAPPTGAEVAIPVPSASGKAAGGGGVANYGLLGATSEFYQLTWGVSVVINTDTVALLAMLHLIVAQTPTTQTTTSATWGPYTPGGLDPLTYRVQVSKDMPQHYIYSIDARPRASVSDADFLPMIDGEILRIKAGVGKGSMVLHYDNRRQLLPNVCEKGAITFLFDNTGSPVTNDVTASQFANNNPMNNLCLNETPYDASYHFDQTPDGAGNFIFNVQANVNKASDNKPALETVDMRSRWQADGAGRSDVKISGGDVTPALQAGGFKDTFVSGSQCWGTAFTTTYETSSPAALNLIATDGDPSSCVFTSQELPNS